MKYGVKSQRHHSALVAVFLFLTSTIAACSTSPYVQQADACRQASTYGQMFGTPERPGPCWGPLITASTGYGMRYYHMRMPTGGQAIVMYDGDKLISVTLG